MLSRQPQSHRIHRVQVEEESSVVEYRQLSIPLAVQAIEHEHKISKPRIIKTVYDKYDDDLYKKAEKSKTAPFAEKKKIPRNIYITVVMLML